MADDDSLPMQVTVACVQGLSPHGLAAILRLYWPTQRVVVGEGQHINGIPLNTVVIE